MESGFETNEIGLDSLTLEEKRIEAMKLIQNYESNENLKQEDNNRLPQCKYLF